jgi:hypothetical protein
MHPDECWCRPGWIGQDCSECIPYWNCVNGFCEKPFECQCNPGYIGKDCNATTDTDGEWGAWGAWSDCSTTCGTYGTETRTR